MIAIGGTAIAVAGVAGCAPDEKHGSPAAAPRSAATGTAPLASPAARGSASVAVGGLKQPVHGSITCSARDGKVFITLGDPLYGLNATVTEGDSPNAQTVGLGTMGGLRYGVGTSPGSLFRAGTADVIKDGNTYRITGNSIGRYPGDVQSPPRTEPYEMVVTCPTAGP